MTMDNLPVDVGSIRARRLDQTGRGQSAPALHTLRHAVLAFTWRPIFTLQKHCSTLPQASRRSILFPGSELIQTGGLLRGVHIIGYQTSSDQIRISIQVFFDKVSVLCLVMGAWACCMCSCHCIMTKPRWSALYLSRITG